MGAKRQDLPAIEGGKPVRAEYLPFFRPSITSSDIDSVSEALRSAWLTLGPLTGPPSARAARRCSSG
jgi:dTDP-4-amino-4,6-dideoxygalactose transaminase